MNIKLVFILFLFASPSILAQTIAKIEGSRVTVTVSESQNIAAGQTINFLDENLEIKAAGIIEKVSPQGRSAIVRVTSGQVAPTYTFERAGAAQAPIIESKPESTAHLNDEEKKILDRGEIGTTAYVLGGVLGTYPLGFGIGHAIQGRYSDKGWIFTVGELGAVTILYSAALDCMTNSSYWNNSNGTCNNKGSMFLGAAAFVALRIWEIVDLWVTPPEHNRRYRSLSARTGRTSFIPLIAPYKDTMLWGFQYRF
jgi:hypothetical protein